MDIKISEEILQIASEIEAELNKQSIPGANEAIPRRVKFLAAQLSGRDRYAAEKAYQIAELAGIFYSERRHWKYPGGYTKLWTDMTFDLLGRIRTQAKNRQQSGG